MAIDPRYQSQRTLNTLVESQDPGAMLNLNRRLSQSAGANVPDASSYEKFNLALMDMLKQAQQGLGTGKFREAELTAQEQGAQRGYEQLPQDIAGLQLSPSQIQEYRRQRQAPFKQQALGAGELRKTFAEQISSFEKILDAARTFGKEFAKISPTPEIIEGYRQSLIAGNNPSIVPEEARNQVLQKMTGDDWNLWAEANRKGERAKSDALTRYQGLTALNSVRTAARQDPDIKIFTDVRGSYEQGRAAYEKGKQGSAPGVGDIVLMRTIAKITDPTSSVREEEFETFKGAQSTMSRFGIRLTKEMWSGDKLTDEGREQIFGMLQDIYNQRKSAYDNAWNFYDLQGQELGYPLGQVIPRYYAPETEIVEKGGRRYRVIPD